MKEIIKKYYGYVIYLCLFAFALFTLIFAFSTTTYAYSINEDGNLVGDNLFNYDYEFNNSSLNVTTNNGLVVVSGNTNNEVIWLTNQTVSLDIGTYYISIQNLNTSNSGLGVFVEFDNNRYENGSFTLNYQATLPVYMRIQIPSSLNVNYSFNIMINRGDAEIEWDPYGVWYSSNNYNAVIEDNEDLQEQINDRTIRELQSGIKANLNRTNLQIYNSSNLSLSQMLNTTPFHLETILFPTNDFNYDMQKCNLDTYNAIINNSGEFTNGDTLTNDPTLLYTFKTPLYIDSLTFSRNGTEGTRYINLYFSDNTSVELVLTEGSENNRTDITWVNSDNKYIEYISTTAEINYNAVVFFSIPNASQIYTSGYSNGYSDGLYDQYQRDSSLIENANQSKQAMYNQGYAKGYHEAASKNDVGWQSLFFAMADTPIKVVSNVLGFELFGLNLFSTFIGMVTVFAVVWLIKKFI